MDNAAIARVLREIADLLEIKDDNPFKIRAYRNGADIVSNHPHEMAVLDVTGLREIPGIGKDLAARIREIVETGDAEFHRELIAEFPPTILDLLNLQGVDADVSAIGNQAFSFVGQNAFSQQAGELRAFVADSTDNRWQVEGDIDGDGIADFMVSVMVAPGHSMSTGDFLL